MAGLGASLAALLAPVALGAALGRARLFADPDAALDALNRVALHVAFPALVVATLGAPGARAAHGPAFYALVPAALALTLGGARALSRAAPQAPSRSSSPSGTPRTSGSRSWRRCSDRARCQRRRSRSPSTSRSP